MPANAADAVTARLRALKAAAEGPAPRAAVTAMAHLGVAGTQVTLSQYSHPPGTPTPSPPGNPPAIITGQLRRSVTATPATQAGPGRYVATVGATAIYARIQEFGGVIVPVKASRLHWVDNAGHHFANQVTIPARPYLRPTTVKLAASGKLTEVASAAFLAALTAR